jgi:preprotein translocase subunit SecG
MPSWAKWGLSLAVAVGLIWVGWRYTPVLVTLHVLVCLVLVAVIMLQSGNAADLAGAFGGAGSQTAFGPRGAATFLSRATTWCAIVFMMTSLTLSVKREPTAASAASGSFLEQTQKAGKAPTAPATTVPPVQAPAQTSQPASTAPATAPAPKAPAQSAPSQK